jgi:hypothetical protein
MFGLETLDMLIGLVTVYLVFALACTSIIEALTALIGMRARNLRKGLEEFLSGDLRKNKAFVDAFYEHPLVMSLSKKDKNNPSYIPGEIVGQVVYALIVHNGVEKGLHEGLKSIPGEPGENRAKALLDVLLEQAEGDKKRFMEEVEKNYNYVIDRVSGWTKRYTQVLAIVISTVFVTVVNIDTIELIRTLSSSPEARAQMVKMAELKIQEKGAGSPDTLVHASQGRLAMDSAAGKDSAKLHAIDSGLQEFEAAGISFGWKEAPDYTNGKEGLMALLTKITGLLISIFAISLGAPFWFDILDKFMNIRAAGRKSESKKEHPGSLTDVSDQFVIMKKS